MTDFDSVTISNSGHELIVLESNLEEHGDPVGGAISCRDITGAVGIRLGSSGAAFGGNSVLVRDGAYQLAAADGSFRAILSSSDDFNSEDGGILRLNAGDDPTEPLPDGSGPPSAFTINAAQRTFVIRSASGDKTVSTSGSESGDLFLYDQAGHLTLILRAEENGLTGLWMGGNQRKGLLILRNGAGKNTVELGGGSTGDLYLSNASGKTTIALRAVEDDVAGIWVGGHDQRGLIVIRDENGVGTISLDGHAGDIVLANADCAEEFPVVSLDEAEAGTVMVIDDDGQLRRSHAPYDARVAGIVAGASGKRPAILLGRQQADASRAPIALNGTTTCKVTAEDVAIAVGDLLTTSARPGHAMRVGDRDRAVGAILGKALAPLLRGTGAIPVLVALQ